MNMQRIVPNFVCTNTIKATELLEGVSIDGSVTHGAQARILWQTERVFRRGNPKQTRLVSSPSCRR